MSDDESLLTRLNSEPTLGVVIVNYRTADLTISCIDSLLRHGIVKPQDIVVVDNASQDDSGLVVRAAQPQVRVILSLSNGGFGAGVNIGVDALSTDLVLVLNPDTSFDENSIELVKKSFRTLPSLGILGLKLVNTDGSLQYSARRFYNLLDILIRRSPLRELPAVRWIADSHLMTKNWSGGAFSSDWVIGAGFVLRRRAFFSVGRMDEGYFLYFEEIDLCARMWIGGWQVMALPHVKLVHEHQRHSKRGIWSSSGKIHFRSMLRFFNKFGVPWVRRPKPRDLESGYVRWQNRETINSARTSVLYQ